MSELGKEIYRKYLQVLEELAKEAFLDNKQFLIIPYYGRKGYSIRYNIWELSWMDYCKATHTFSRSCNRIVE